MLRYIIVKRTVEPYPVNIKYIGVICVKNIFYPKQKIRKEKLLGVWQINNSYLIDNYIYFIYT
jgi:hypothetical protein